MGRNQAYQAEEIADTENPHTNRFNTRPSRSDVQGFLGLKTNVSRFRPSQDSLVDETSGPNIAMHSRKYASTIYHVDQAEIYLQNQVDLIVSKMEEDPCMKEDSVESKKFRKETLKHMAQCLTVKRNVKRKLTESLSVRPKGRPISFLKRMKYRTSMKYSQMKLKLRNFFNSRELWYGSLKSIEGKLGSSTSSYFKFLRWLFLMNFSMMIVTLIFIVLPELTLRNMNELKDNLLNYKLWDVFTGEGSFTNTIMYYGNYSTGTVNIFGLPYSMPHAYFYTMLFLYVVSVLILSYSVTQSYRKSFIQAEEGLKNVFGIKIFCGWDYSIATKEAAEFNSKAIYIELKELLSDVELKDIDVSWIQNLKITMARLMATVAVFLLITLAGGFLWFLMKIHKDNDIGLPFIVALIANCLNVILPMLFTKISSYENYKKQSQAVGITLIRSFLLSTVIVGTLVTFWLRHSVTQKCWETSLGQEMYRLILADFLLIVANHLAYFVFFTVKRYCFKIPVVIEFDVASNTLDLIYSQSFFWVGFYFSPLLSVVVSMKICITWYIKKYYVLKVCQPSTKAWRALQTHTWFLTLTFLTAIATNCVMVFIITKISTTDCGPFQHYKYIYEVLLEIFDQNKFPLLKYLDYVTKPGVVTLIIGFLCVQVYYVKQKVNGKRGVVKMLRTMIAWESKDKKFLLESISNIIRQELQYNELQSLDEDIYNSVPKDIANQYSGFGDIGASTSESYWR